MDQIKFGFCVPIFANPGMAFFRTPAYKKLDWSSLKETVILCDNIGYDSIFVADHVFLGRDGDIWECMTLMSAFAALTKRIEVIPIHLCNNFRTPSIVAKAMATLSHVADGRVALFYDYGWRRAEFDAYGVDFCDDDNERIAQMAEGLTIIQGMLEEEQFSYTGKHYTVKNAICNPKPVKPIPVWMGEANNAEMVRHIVKHADVFNSMPCSIEGFETKIGIIKEECARQSRDFSSLGLSLETQVLICENEDEIDRVYASFDDIKHLNNSYDKDILDQLKATNPELESYNSRASYEDEFIMGTPEIVIDKLKKYVDLGVTHFMLWFMDYPSQKGITLFADEVMPHFKK